MGVIFLQSTAKAVWGQIKGPAAGCWTRSSIYGLQDVFLDWNSSQAAVGEQGEKGDGSPDSFPRWFVSLGCAGMESERMIQVGKDLQSRPNTTYQ